MPARTELSLSFSVPSPGKRCSHTQRPIWMFEIWVQSYVTRFNEKIQYLHATVYHSHGQYHSIMAFYTTPIPKPVTLHPMPNEVTVHMTSSWYPDNPREATPHTGIPVLHYVLAPRFRTSTVWKRALTRIPKPMYASVRFWMINDDSRHLVHDLARIFMTQYITTIFNAM